jgi:3-deoxy-D-manno-octulosonic-acid transferase
VPDAGALLAEAARLLGDAAARARMSEQAMAFAGRHRGATVRTVELLRQFIR